MVMSLMYVFRPSVMAQLQRDSSNDYYEVMVVNPEISWQISYVAMAIPEPEGVSPITL
jgi:hypothetical protein